MAETAFDVISRCRVTSVSSRVGGTEGTCSGAVNYIDIEPISRKRDKPESVRVTTGGNTPEVAD